MIGTVDILDIDEVPDLQALHPRVAIKGNTPVAYWVCASAAPPRRNGGHIPRAEGSKTPTVPFL
jgi:hypothetical protein